MHSTSRHERLEENLIIRSASRSLRQWTAGSAFAWLAPMWAGAQIGLPAPDPGACDPGKASCIKVCSPLDAMLGKCKPDDGAPSDPGRAVVAVVAAPRRAAERRVAAAVDLRPRTRADRRLAAAIRST